MNYCCPCCGDVLFEKDDMYHCGLGSFHIRKEKFDEMVADMYKRGEYKETLNTKKLEELEEIEELDRPEVTEDFSDSPFL